MVKGDMIRNGEFDKIREMTKEAVELAAGLTMNFAPAAAARSTCFVVSTVPAPTNISGYFSDQGDGGPLYDGEVYAYRRHQCKEFKGLS